MRPYLLVFAALAACGPRGPEWLRADSATDKGLHAVHGTAADDVWAVGDDGLVLHFNGAAWTRVDSGVPAKLTGVWAAARNDVWMVGDASTVLHWNGTAITRVATGVDRTFKLVWGLTPRDVWFSTGSQTWWFDGARFAEVDSYFGVRSMGGTQATGLWLVDDSNDVYVAAGGGATPVNVGTSDDWDFVVPAQGGGVYVVAASTYSRSKVLFFDGQRWKPVDLPADDASGLGLLAGWGQGPSAWFVGEDSSIVQVDGSEVRVEANGGYSAPDLEAAWGASPQDVWVVGAKGTLLRRYVTP